MCSIFKYKNCVGRNFDYDVSYNEELRIIKKGEYYSSYNIIGMCTGLVKDEPLMYDGMNEKGLVCGALAFEGNAYYYPPNDNKFSPPSYEFVLYVLRNFETVEQVKKFINNDMFQISNEAYSEEMPPSDLHWFVADKKESIIVEQTKRGLSIYNGEVMTNNPPYEDIILSVPLYNKHVGIYKGINPLVKFEKYSSRGIETINLNGDYTSLGRNCRLSYLKEKLEKSKTIFDDISQSFHLLSSIEQIYGVTQVKDRFEYTIYSIVYDMRYKKIYLKMYNDLIIKEVSFNDL